jgi:hypothetical protein
MKSLKNLFIQFALVFMVLFGLSLPVYAANIFGIDDPQGCGGKDPFLPNLLICGRSPSTGACQQYTQPCSLGDLVETGKRAIVWLVSITLLIVPIIVMYYGAMIMWNQEFGGGVVNLAELRKKFRMIFIFFILLLAAWLIVRTVVDIFQVDERINTFMIDENGQPVKARNFNTN